jgi:2,3-bisphosphoglycerate-dependent phosphoglycerate mutase
MPRLVLLRHGQSEWNLLNRFTGWEDVDLSPQGEAEAVAAGRELRDANIIPDVVHTSVQRRATRTADLVLQELGVQPEIRRSWRLNERHYGALQGLDKKETVAQHGEEQVKIWRRSYATPPPPMSDDDWAKQRAESVYRDVPDADLPRSESLADVVARMMPYWESDIAADLQAGKVVLVVAHGNSLRALVKDLQGFTEDEILEVNIPTGIPLEYDLDDSLRPTDSLTLEQRYLGDPEAVRAAAEAVERQTGASPP